MRYVRVDNYILEAPITDILDALQMSLKNGKLASIGTPKAGDENILVTCPHHSGGHEAKPAGQIYIGESDRLPYGFFNCFVCGFKGTFDVFVAECMDCSIEYAKKWLIDRFGKLLYEKISLGDDIKIPGRYMPKSNYNPLETELNNYEPWCPYFAQRKLSRKTCDEFQLKYDPIYRQVVFPCRDMYGRLIMLPKRSIDTKTFYLDKDVKKPVYCLDYIMKHNIHAAIVTEGPFDCLTAYEYGFPAIATLGKMADHQIEQINRSCLTTIYTMFDNDAAGRAFTENFKNKVSSRILVTNLPIPAGKKDINDLSREEFKNILKKYANLEIDSRII